jgi:hypothetical protein
VSKEDIHGSIKDLWRNSISEFHFNEICQILSIKPDQKFNQGQFFGCLAFCERYMFTEFIKVGIIVYSVIY